MKKLIPILLIGTSVLFAGGDISTNSYNNSNSYTQNEGNKVYIEDKLMWQDSKYTDNEQMAKGDLRSLGKVGKWKYARKYCDNISFNGYNDWRLPTKDELINLHKKMNTVTNIIDSDYWTSTPVSSKMAWAVYPIAESGFKHLISDTHYFRCVRDIKEVN